jgi:hypothetical protein
MEEGSGRVPGNRGCRPAPRVRAARPWRLPGVGPRRGGPSRRGYEVTLAALDRLVSHPRFYTRTRIALHDGTTGGGLFARPGEGRGKPGDLVGGWRAHRQDSDTGWGRDGADEVFPVGEGKRALSLTCVLGMG